jgi:hypothetical protein
MHTPHLNFLTAQSAKHVFQFFCDECGKYTWMVRAAFTWRFTVARRYFLPFSHLQACVTKVMTVNRVLPGS